MTDEKNNIFVINIDMENRKPEDIARDVALKINEIADNLVDTKKEQEFKRL